MRDKFLCRLRTNPDALVIRVIDVGDQEALLLGQPGRVLQDPALRQRALRARAAGGGLASEQLAELIEDAWRTQAPKRLIAAHDAVSEVARARARGQWLHAPGGDVLAHLLALQAQDVRTPALALGARGGALSDSMRITWLMRTTLHLVHAADLEWLHPLFAPRQVAGNARRLEQLGRERGAGRPRGRADRRARAGDAPRARVAPRRARHPGRWARRSRTSCTGAALRGRVALTPDRVFVSLALPAPGSRDAALDELARRYFACHAGATADDLAYWSGLPARDVRSPVETPMGSRPCPARVVAGLRRAPARLARPHADRPAAQLAKRVHPGGGILRAVVLEDGVAVGTWCVRGEALW